MAHNDVHMSLRPFFASVAFISLHVLLFLLVMQILGIRLTIFAALLAAMGAAAGLALSGTLQNFAGGILILMLKPFKVGDNIVAQGQEGTVTSIQIFFTIVTTFDNKTVIIPNSKLSNEIIINITQLGSRRLDITLKYPYTTAYGSINKILANLFKEMPEVCKEPPPRISILSMDKDDYTILIQLWVKAHGYEDSRFAINDKIMSATRVTNIKD